MTPRELEQIFYDSSYNKVDKTYIEWCNVCEQDTKHSFIIGHNGLDSYSYSICSRCGNKF